MVTPFGRVRLRCIFLALGQRRTNAPRTSAFRSRACCEKRRDRYRPSAAAILGQGIRCLGLTDL